MTITVSEIGHGIADIGGTEIANSALAAITRITHCTFYNAHTAGVTVTAYYLRLSETIASDGALKAKKQIAPGQTWICSELIGQNLAGGSNLFIVPSVDNVIHYNVSGDIIA